ncbi:MAG TPA: hypothetical protein EYM54_13745 [Dehalococcoidia bacterium]|jgi:hypothetical protein|nr:MAG: hypothetical protein COB68_02375 [SAR202 cluster bacterium]HIM81152.1 hypothetical protein [Dehalococcoidia bacterium]|tara:strand:+ start:1672 stop:2439 length:768 start_codon:yes stop_codon:yes gene_type:complete
MYLVYLGESGNTGVSVADSNQPHHVHVGLLIHESQSISINGEFNALCRRHFGRPLGEAGTPKELRPSDIFQGRGDFTSWPVQKRHELIQDCLSILIRRETPLITAYVDKETFAKSRSNGDDPNMVWESPSEITMGRFLFALNMFVDELNMSGLNSDQLMESQWPVADFAMVVAGDGRSVEPRFMTQFLKSDDGMDSTAVLANFCYVGSEHSVGTQLANMCAYFARRWLQNPSSPQPYFEALRDGKVVQVVYNVQM